VRVNPRNTKKRYSFSSTNEYRRVPNWIGPKNRFFDPKTSKSVVKLRTALGKIQKITKKADTVEILQGLYFDHPIFDHFGHICEAKNFFILEVTTPQNNFPICP